jgi:hypothetical protein
MSYTNADGLRILTNGDAGVPAANGLTAKSEIKTLVVTVDATAGAVDFNNAEDAFIPAGSFLKSATLFATTTLAGGTSIDLGFVNAAGTEIDADGIVDAATLAEINAGHVCDGADIGTVISASADAYVSVSVVTGTFTAGVAKLVLEYIEA